MSAVPPVFQEPCVVWSRVKPPPLRLPTMAFRWSEKIFESLIILGMSALGCFGARFSESKRSPGIYSELTSLVLFSKSKSRN